MATASLADRRRVVYTFVTDTPPILRNIVANDFLRGSMEEEKGPVRIVLTPEQREAVHRMSGQHVEMIELEPDDAEPKKDAGPLKFRWRLSAVSGIPRQAWGPDDSTPPKAS